MISSMWTGPSNTDDLFRHRREQSGGGLVQLAKDMARPLRLSLHIRNGSFGYSRGGSYPDLGDVAAIDRHDLQRHTGCLLASLATRAQLGLRCLDGRDRPIKLLSRAAGTSRCSRCGG